MSGPNTRRRRRNQILLLLGSVTVSIILIGVLGGGATALGLSAFVQQLAVAFSGLALLLLTAFQWRDLDELGRQINATAYFWSGMLTWTLVLVLMAISSAGTPQMGPAFPVFAAALLLIAVHALLHGLFTAVLKLRNRLQ